MHKPNITLACVVHCHGKFLLVEEYEAGKLTLNQPAGHLEKEESLLQGASRELFEETGIQAVPQKLIKIYQWHAPRTGLDFLRFTFALELPQYQPIKPQDPDIVGGKWLSLAEFDEYCSKPNQAARSPLVRQSILDYLKGDFCDLDILRKIFLI
ncbi:phosphatase NudJ [Volucribacter psittacicida]|uniref:Phosphatase NudJ n=1 Tax=Volucribacter psittacicida TaxID=203482 RepID=A0A4R1FQZ2_9PAST|nr:NUDIX hydrolase [Volucribacter psittacicida]TCJ95909.1 phosphatase NudJ [Volucribacter psittacicida]